MRSLTGPDPLRNAHGLLDFEILADPISRASERYTSKQPTAAHSPSRKAERGKQKLRCSLNQDIDDDARGSKRARHGPERQEPCANDVSTNLHQRQQGIDRFSNEPQENRRSRAPAHFSGMTTWRRCYSPPR